MHDPLPILTARQLLQSEVFLRHLARALQPDDQRAEDLVQETWLRALQRPPSRPESLRAWLATTARFLAGKQVRGEARRARREEVAARPEATAGTDQIVQKLEVEQQVVQAVLRLREPYRSAILLRYYQDRRPAEIAELLEVPLNTVRSRLRRGLEELRVSLDPSTPRRLRAVFLAGPGAGLSPAASVGTTLGVISMKWKAALWILFPVVLGGLAMVVVPFVMEDPRTIAAGPDVSGQGTDGRSNGLARGGPEGPDRAGGNATPSAIETGANGGDRRPHVTRLDETAALAGTRPGQIRFAVVDARTDRPVNDVNARFLGERRFAELGADGEVEALLTPDRYDITLARAGYDPVHIEGVEVKPEQELCLGEVEMNPGTGWIEGRVTASHLESDQLLCVDLYGTGRHPCSRCVFVAAAEEDDDGTEESESDRGPRLVRADPAAAWSRDSACPDCGYAADSSRLWVRPGGTFAFANLAGGSYTVRVWSDDHQPFGRSRMVTLEPRDRAWLEFRMVATADASFVLLDERGGPFRNTFEENGEVSVDLILFSIYRDGVKVGQSSFWLHEATLLTSGATYHRLTLRNTALRIQEFSRTEVVFDDQVLRQFAARGHIVFEPDSEPEPLDRERTAEDALWPVYAPPDFEPSGISASHEGDYTLTRLPCELLEVEVECGRYRSGRVPFQPSPWHKTPTVLVMKESDEEPEEVIATVIDAHGEQVLSAGISLAIRPQLFLQDDAVLESYVGVTGTGDGP